MSSMEGTAIALLAEAGSAYVISSVIEKKSWTSDVDRCRPDRSSIARRPAPFEARLEARKFVSARSSPRMNESVEKP